MTVSMGAATSRAPSRRELAARLAATKRQQFLLRTALGIIAPLALWASGLSDALWQAVTGWPRWYAVAAQSNLLTLLLLLISMPQDYFSGYVVRHRYGLSTQTLGGWLADWAKTTLLLLILTTGAACVFYGTVWSSATFWPVLFWLAAMAAIVLLTFIAPYVFVPLFFKPQPVDDPGVVMVIEDLVRKAGTTVAGISRLDFSRRTNEANAAVIGFGRSRRVVLADTLLATFTPSESRAVVAHELGHHIHRDVPKLMAVQAVVMALGLGLGAPLAEPLLRTLGAGPLASPASYPLLVLAATVFGLLCLPFMNAVSRAIEAHADTYAFNLLGDGRSFAAAMRRLADQNLAEERPPRWAEILMYTHPPIWRRVARAEAANRE
jgi:STE24 endopeptidase